LQGRAEEAAVERHAALPDGDDVKRVGEVTLKVVKQNVADAAAKHDAERRVDQ
jgi:hypothetical protein